MKVKSIHIERGEGENINVTFSFSKAPVLPKQSSKYATKRGRK